jgi:sec-independent protein translocase protein TatC
MQYKWIPEVGTRIVPMIRIGSYISFIIKGLFWIGLCFELPAIIFILARIGLVSHRWLLKQWRWATIGIFIFAAFITPTGNVINQNVSDIVLLDLGFIVSGPLIVLYLLSILLAWLAKRTDKAPPVAAMSQD